MVNKLIVDGLNITLNESTALPFTYTFSTAGTHNVKIGLDDTEEICAYAFKDCADLTKVTFPDKITMIKRNAFENCESLKSIDIPATIKYVGPNVFDGCTVLSEINFEDTKPPIFLTNLEDNTTCYVPDYHKFVLADELVKDGSVQYYEKNELGGYDEVDYEALEDGNEYYYDNWLTVHNHYNVVENRFKNRPMEIGFYDGGVKVKDFPNVEQGTTTKLFDYDFVPQDTTNRKVHWLSSNPNLVSVDQEGNITVASNVAGRSTIYVCTEPYYDGSYVFASLNVRVTNNSGITKTDPILNYSESSITITGEEYELPTLTNENNVNVVYSSTNEEVATINENGEIEIIGNGTTTIKATFLGSDIYNAKEASYILIVNIPSEELEDISDEEFTFGVNNIEVTSISQELPTLTNTKNIEVEYISTNSEVATIDENGEIYIIGNGETTIKAVFGGNEQYNPKEASYVLTINIEDDLEVEYESDDNNIQIINSDQDELEVEYESSDNNIQIINSDQNDLDVDYESDDNNIQLLNE